MSADLLTRASRIELARQLQVAAKAARHWIAVLTVDVDPAVGRFDASACRAAQADMEDALAIAQSIYADEVPRIGLLLEQRG